MTAIMLALVLCSVCGIRAFADDGTAVNYERIGEQIAEDVRRYHIPAMAVAVVDKDKVLFEQTYGECKSADQPFIIGSMSKSFTALAIMQLAEQGKLDLAEPMDKYIDSSEWFKDGSDHSRITIKDLLNHTSGITTFQQFGSLESTDSYGNHVYANANYGLLGLIIEAVSGMSYEDYVTKNIFDPLGMEHSAASLEKSKKNGLIDGYRNYFGFAVSGECDYPEEIQKGSWTNVPAGYLSSSLSDMEKYLQMYLRGGESVVGSRSIESMFYDNVPGGEDGFYGFGWTYSKDPSGQPMLNHAGLVENYTSNMFILPEKEIAVVVLVNMNDYLVGNALLGDVTAPLLGQEKQNSANMYVILHAAIDAVCLALFFVSIHSAVTLKKWTAKAGKRRTVVADIIRHIVLPIALLSIPLVMGTPYSVLWLFTKDLAIVIVANAALLTAIGVFKGIHFVRVRRAARN